MLNLEPTRELHAALAAMLPREQAPLRRALAVANHELAARRLTFARIKRLTAALTALILEPADIARIQRTAESLHAVIEKVIDFLLATPERRCRFFGDHERIFPFLAPTRGCPTWQVVSRYDVAVTPDGQLKLMELNTGCPGGFMIAETMSDVARHGFAELPMFQTTTCQWTENATIRPGALIDALLALEASAGIETDAIGLLNDENDLVFELDLVADGLRRHGRTVLLTDAATLRHETGMRARRGALIHDSQVLSLVYNKFRISTPRSRNHCWRDGFENRYAAFLAAQKSGDVVSINNLVGMLLAEDKSLLACLREPDVRAELTPEEIELVDDHVLWTARWQEGRVLLDGQEIDLIPFVRQHPDRFVIKPANEGRGFDVVIGRFASPAEWAAATAIDPDMPKVVQEFTPAAAFPVISLAGEEGGLLHVRPMFLTLGLALIRGTFQGLISRVSANAVTNVAREGFGQGVMVAGAPDTTPR